MIRLFSFACAMLLVSCGVTKGSTVVGDGDDSVDDGSEDEQGPSNGDSVDDDPDEPGDSDDPGDDSPDPEDTVVDLDLLLDHLDALQSIADANDGNRAVGSPGFDASVEYVTAQLEGYGYDVSFHEFDIASEQVNAVSELRVVSPDEVELEYGEDFINLGFTGSGDVMGQLVAVDVTIPPADEPNSSTSGCEASDFDGFTAGSIALIQRGTCRFQDKLDNAVAAGAVAMLMFNEGQEDRTSLFPATLSADSPEDVPALVLTYEIGAQLALLATERPLEMQVVTDVSRININTVNTIAETPGASGQVVVVGAHLDSVREGPGINDNGSGTGLVLELARQYAASEMDTNHGVRFVLWGGEELGLLGSFAYVQDMQEELQSTVLANLNFDMVASPNPVRFIYDGDGTLGGESGPAGSETIEQLFIDWFDSKGLESTPTPFDGRSDYGPFIWSGMPAGGLFTGAEGVMNSWEASIYDGVSGEAYDSCYHQWCDTTENIDPVVFGQMADAALSVMLTVADQDVGLGPAGPAPFGADGYQGKMPVTIGGCHGQKEMTQ